MKKTHLTTFVDTYRVFFASVSLLLLTVAFYVFLYISIQKKGATVATLRAETAALEMQESEIGKLRTNLVSTEIERKQISSYFIEEGDVVPFLETLEGYAKDMGVTLKFNSIAIAKDPLRLNISLTAEGLFANIYRFTALLETSPYEIVFNTAQIEALPSEIPTTKGALIPPPKWNEQISLSVLSVKSAK
ncbi:MAG: hypothetical protein KBC17_03495 [Candidatus Pacebacteria bacterium]|nr:hypothetical protein [Candidatus Paceibacterota bacterium]